jgi:hypothetical protein
MKQLLVIGFLLCNFCYAQDNCKLSATFLTEKFNTFKVIGLDEGPHGTLQCHAFIRNLFDDMKFCSTLDYIIVEFVNVDFQSTLDRFINGEEITLEQIQNIWRHTTQSHTPLFESPVYLQLLETVREVNKRLPMNNSIRVLAGDPAMDWSGVKTRTEYIQRLSQRDVWPSELAIQYGIKADKNVLVIFGGMHLLKTSDPKKDSTRWTIPYYINQKYPNSMFTIGLLNSQASSMETNEIAVGYICESKNSPMEGLYDAYYYVGPSKKFIRSDPGLIDRNYWTILNERSKIVWGEEIDEKLKAN